jgi:MarR-like DNA-binding transcriptional regulator SgrR of sgrS sRNA
VQVEQKKDQNTHLDMWFSKMSICSKAIQQEYREKLHALTFITLGTYLNCSARFMKNVFGQKEREFWNTWHSVENKTDMQ